MNTVPVPGPVTARHRSWPRRPRCWGIALDLGSARTRAWSFGGRMIVDVPTVGFLAAGATYPVRRGAIVDTPGAARMLDRLLGHRLPRYGRPLVVVATPVLGGMAYRTEARTAVEVLRPRAFLTVPAARAIAVAADADLTRPSLVVSGAMTPPHPASSVLAGPVRMPRLPRCVAGRAQGRGRDTGTITETLV